MDLEDNMLSEISQPERDKSCIIPLYVESKIVIRKLSGAESRRKEKQLKGTKFQLHKLNKF